MKRQTFLATFLIFIFTVLTIMAGMTPNPEDADESVSVNAKSGWVVPGWPWLPFWHNYSDVLTLKYSGGCTTVVAAKYNITHKVKVKGWIAGGYEGTVTLTTSLDILDNNSTSVGNDPGNGQNLAVRPFLGLDTVFRKSWNKKYLFTTSSAGNYSAKGTGSASGIWSHLEAPNLHGTATWNDDTDEQSFTVGTKTKEFE